MSERNAVRNELSLAQENAALRSRVAVLKEELALIREQLAWLKKQVFGRKTEQSSVIMDNGQQLTLFPEESHYENSKAPADRRGHLFRAGASRDIPNDRCCRQSYR